MVSAPNRQRHCFHGATLELTCGVAAVREEIDHLFGESPAGPSRRGSVPTVGSIRPYDEAEVVGRLPACAERLASAGETGELYRDGERLWAVDDRWGTAEVNLLKGRWRSWVLPAPALDPVQVAEGAVLRPLALLLRARGLFLLPAASVARDGWGALILSPLNLAAELEALVRAGFRLVGQRWTLLRERAPREGGSGAVGLELLRVPGQVERPAGPAARPAPPGSAALVTARQAALDSYGPPGAPAPAQWVDLAREFGGAEVDAAACDAVLRIGPGRGPDALAALLPPARAAEALRRHWPAVELSPHRRPGHPAAKVAQQARCYDVQLSPKPHEFVLLLEGLRRPPLSQPSPARPDFFRPGAAGPAPVIRVAARRVERPTVPFRRSA